MSDRPPTGLEAGGQRADSTPAEHEHDPEISGPLAADPPDLQATALSYEPGDRAPQVLATGRGHVAEQIIAVAREAGVPIREDPALARALAALDLGEEVPELLYRAVAEALAWAYGLDAEAARRLR